MNDFHTYLHQPVPSNAIDLPSRSGYGDARAASASSSRTPESVVLADLPTDSDPVSDGSGFAHDNVDSGNHYNSNPHMDYAPVPMALLQYDDNTVNATQYPPTWNDLIHPTVNTTSTVPASYHPYQTYSADSQGISIPWQQMGYTQTASLGELPFTQPFYGDPY